MADEMTPTMEEFVHSFVPTKWPVHTPEDLFYWNLKGSIALSAFTVRVAFLMRAGMTFAQAGYVATDTYAWSRIVTKGRTMITAVKYSPLIAVTYLGATKQHEAMAEHGSGVRGTGTFGVSPSHHLVAGKPWWES